ncbi:MAG: NAD(P)H-binding protein [Bacteroidetes bacterium]|nr:NAD(P)H-binding protein [Bacteroidota bacterium]
MKIVVTGSLGHIGKPLTKELVEKGYDVTVISSKAERQKDIEALGAKAAIGRIEDVPFLTAAFSGADLVYTMIPPTDFRSSDYDLIALCRELAGNFAEVVQKAGIKRVVHLSSIGAHMEKNSGLILGHHSAEVILNELQDVNITYMRPTAFYYNLLAFLPVIKNAGVITSNYGGEDVVPWVSPIDIAAAIAEEVAAAPSHRKVRYVASEELSCNEVASILGEAIGKPELKWTTISNEQMLANITAFGMPKQIAAAYVEMNASMHSGELFEDYYKNKPVFGKVNLKDFAKDFAIAYAQN